MSALLEQLNLGVGDVVDKVRRSLVQVHNGGRGAGSGVIWHRDGLIITNAHVVSDNGRRPDKKGKLRVTLPDGTTLPARLLARDEDRDVAALLVEAQELAPIELGTSRDLQPGVSLELRPGHSGGPLVDEQGRLIGINTMMAGPEVGMVGPVHVVKEFLRQTLGSEVPAPEMNSYGTISVSSKSGPGGDIRDHTSDVPSYGGHPTVLPSLED